ncbi:MAG: hypothetical protein IPQ08_05480 [Chitinophagaceae bacterium]|nr:hypothetical protein [Chitinophagaceae bacterium]
MELSATFVRKSAPLVLSRPVPALRSCHPNLVRQDPSPSFILTMIHEIRSPLTNINLSVEVLKHLIKDNELNQYLDMILRSSNRINEIVAGLLVDPNAIKILPARYSVQSLLDEILLSNNDRIMLKDVTVRRNYSSVDTKREFDRGQLKMALTNIILNAIEAMPKLNSQLEIVTKLLHGVCFIIIKDNGIGLSPLDLRNIFTPYFSKRVGGLGVGLSDTESLLKLNHIGVHVRSELGKGTRFILSFKME